MKNKICLSRKQVYLFLFIFLVAGLMVGFSLLLNLSSTSVRTKAAPPKIINVTPMPIRQDEFPSYAILNSAMDYYQPNKDNEYKYSLNGSTICGGVVVGDNWVVTAAHCVENKDINTLRIALNLSRTQGQLNKRTAVDEALKYFYKVEMVIPHPLYSSYPLYDNDIALVQLDRDTPYSIPKATLPTDISSYNTAQQLTVVGVGCIKIAPTPGLSPPYSKDQYSRQYSLDVQKGYFNYVVKDKTANNPEIFLTNPQNEEKAICSGDSGSPMMLGNTLLGVTYSWIAGDYANPGYGTLVYTRSEWIKATMAMYDKLGVNCYANMDKNYSDLISQKVSATNKKVFINVRNKEDLFVVTNIVRGLSTQPALSNKEIWINYSCDEETSNLFQESISLQNVGSCTPARRFESCMRLPKTIQFRLYKDGKMYDEMSEFTSQYEKAFRVKMAL